MIEKKDISCIYAHKLLFIIHNVITGDDKYCFMDEYK